MHSPCHEIQFVRSMKSRILPRTFCNLVFILSIIAACLNINYRSGFGITKSRPLSLSLWLKTGLFV